ncbi:DNA-directed DNA polymerase [Tanacetum coccineum]
MASQDARLSKFEADFKQQQSEMTNKIDTVLKAITDQITGTLPSDTVKNPKLGTHPVSSAQQVRKLNSMLESLGLVPQSSNTKFVCSKEDDGEVMFIEIIRDDDEPHDEGPNEGEGATTKEPVEEYFDTFLTRDELTYHRLGDSKPFDALADLGSCVNIIPLYLFKKLNIGLLEETDHIFGLADETKSYPVRIVKDVEVHIGRLKLLNDFYVLNMKKDPETPLLVGRGFLATANAVIDCRMTKIAIGEGITSSDEIGAKPPYYARKDFLDCHLPEEWGISRDAELNPFKDTLVFRRMVEFLGAILETDIT